MVTYNPYTEKYNNLQKIIKVKTMEKQNLQNELNWYLYFDISKKQYLLTNKEEEKIKTKLLIKNIQNEINKLKNQKKSTEKQIKTLFSPFNWFDKEQKKHRTNLNALNKIINFQHPSA